MANGEVVKGDPFKYLGRMGGLTKSGISKATDRVSVPAHTRGKPTGKTKGNPTYTGSEGPNPAMPGGKTTPSTYRNPKEQGPGAATLASRKKSGSKGGATTTAKSGSAAAAVHEAGESKAYEKMEEKAGANKKSLTVGFSKKK